MVFFDLFDYLAVAINGNVIMNRDGLPDSIEERDNLSNDRILTILVFVITFPRVAEQVQPARISRQK